MSEASGIPNFNSHFLQLTMTDRNPRGVSIAECACISIGGSPLASSSEVGFGHWYSTFLNAASIHQTICELRGDIDEHPVVHSPKMAILLIFSLFHECRRWKEGEGDSQVAYSAEAIYTSFGYECAVAAAAAMATLIHQSVKHPARLLLRKGFAGYSAEYANTLGTCLDADRMESLLNGKTRSLSDFYHGKETLERALEIRRSNKFRLVI